MAGVKKAGSKTRSAAQIAAQHKAAAASAKARKAKSGTAIPAKRPTKAMAKVMKETGAKSPAQAVSQAETRSKMAAMAANAKALAKARKSGDKQGEAAAMSRMRSIGTISVTKSSSSSPTQPMRSHDAPGKGNKTSKTRQSPGTSLKDQTWASRQYGGKPEDYGRNHKGDLINQVGAFKRGL